MPESKGKHELFRHATKGEEPLTDFFVSLLAWSDVSEVLNAIHGDDDIEFDESAKIVATQRDGLRHHPKENIRKRTLDWVVEDETKLVGYESKRGGDLYANQLQEERRKLEINADSKEVHLFAFTEDVREPDIEADFCWKGWSDVGKAIHEKEEKSKTVEILAEMFRYMGYEGFTGFTEYERSEQWFVKHQNEALDFALDTTELASDLTIYDKDWRNIDHHARVTPNIHKVKKNSYKGLALPYFVFCIHPEGYHETDTEYDVSELGWYIAIVVPGLRNEVYVQMNIYPSKYGEAKRDLNKYAEEISEIVESNDMHVDASWNSLVQADKSPIRYTDRDEIKSILREKAGEETWKRLRFGWEVDTDQLPENMLKEAAEKMEELHKIFYNGVERRTDFSK